MEPIQARLSKLANALAQKADRDQEFRKLLLENPNHAVTHYSGKPLPQAIVLKVHEDQGKRLYIAANLKSNQQMLNDSEATEVNEIIQAFHT